MCHHFWIRVDVTNSSLSNAMVSGLSVSSLMNLRLIQVLLLLQRHVDVCGTALNAFGWNSFLTRCSFFMPFYSILVCVQYYLFLWYSVCHTVISDKDCQLIPPVYNVSFSHAYLYLTRLCSVKCILSLNKGFGYGSKLKSLGRQACVPTT